MVKMRKGDTLILGLSDENINRLQQNQPIRFKLSDLIPGSKDTVFIVAGKTEESIALTLKSMIETSPN
jgi:hypothetical protein